MKEVGGTVRDGKVLLTLSGHIDSNNAAEAEQAIGAVTAEAPGAPILIDARELTYISSAGLRVILHLRKTCRELEIREVRPEVYEIFEEQLMIAKSFSFFFSFRICLSPAEEMYLRSSMSRTSLPSGCSTRIAAISAPTASALLVSILSSGKIVSIPFSNVFFILSAPACIS